LQASSHKLAAPQQIIGREGETATFLSALFFTLNLCGGGFAPRQLRRYAAKRGLRRAQSLNRMNRQERKL
jgi:hypothetical protein